MKYETTKEAVYTWVNEFNAIPTDMIAQLMEDHPYDWTEETVFDENDEPYGLLPMWGTMWSFGDSCDDWWLENGDGVQKMSECGIRIYYHEEWGWFFGIDGAGYDFYSEHWIPLYKARGLKWSDEDEEVEE